MCCKATQVDNCLFVKLLYQHTLIAIRNSIMLWQIGGKFVWICKISFVYIFVSRYAPPTVRIGVEWGFKLYIFIQIKTKSPIRKIVMISYEIRLHCTYSKRTPVILITQTLGTRAPTGMAEIFLINQKIYWKPLIGGSHIGSQQVINHTMPH